MVIGFIGLLDGGNSAAHEWLCHAISKWLARQDALLGISSLRNRAEDDFVRLCARQSIPFRLFLPHDHLNTLGEKSHALLAQAQSIQLLSGGANELVVFNCDVLLLATPSGDLAELQGLLQLACSQQRAVCVFDCARHHDYIHCHPEKLN